jgi:histidinol phosphatase-like enzyme
MLARHRVLAEVAVEQGTSAETIALAWLMSFEGPIVPVPGATRVSSAQALAHTANVRLSDEQRERLDRAFAGRLLRVPRSQRRPPDDARGDVVLVMGMPGAGKTTVACELTSAGYERLNRDERGGALADLVPELDRNLASGRRQWVLDNTYPTRASRNEVIECAWSHAVPVRCVHVTTPLPDAQCNAIVRMIEAHGRLPMPEELRDLAKRDPRYLGPDAQFRYERSVEAPVIEEGFTAVEERPFVRQAPTGATARAIFLDYDDLVLHGADGSPVRAPDDVRLADGRKETLSRYHEDGWHLFAHAWRPPGARARQTDAGDGMQRCFERTGELLGFSITFACCVHDAGPPVCWCRKPLPGLLIEFAMGHHIALGSSLAIGVSAADRTMANRLGVRFEDSRAFFADV